MVGLWLYLRSERSSLGSRFLGLFEFWVCSWFAFDRIFWISFVAFAERAEPTWKLLGFFRIFFIWFVVDDVDNDFF